MATVIFDEVDKQILRALSRNGRESAAALAGMVGLTRQAVADRLERLRNEGVIRGYTLAVDPDKLGLTVRAFMAITLLPACSDEAEKRVIELLRGTPWVQECYRVTGDDYFQVRIVAPDIQDLRRLVVALRATGAVQSTRTMLALENLFEKSPLPFIETPPEETNELGQTA